MRPNRSRRPSDTYYLDDDRLLRTHTSAHQTELLKNGRCSTARFIAHTYMGIGLQAAKGWLT